MDPNGGKAIIKEFRCSLVWVSLLTKDSKLANRKNYYDEFDNASANKGEWSLPWLEKPRIFFWESYLETSPLLTTPSQQNAYVLDYDKTTRCIVPLRRKKGLGKIDLLDGDKVPSNEVVSLWIEGFAYPHGVSCIITLRWRSQGGLELEKMVDRLIELRNATFSWSSPILTPDKTGKKQTLKDISCDALNYLSSEIDGGKLHNFQADPFTVVTVVEAENAPSESRPVEGDSFHKALDALCNKMPDSTWDWRKLIIKPVPLEKALLITKGQDGILYAHGRGRVVWLPRYFRQNCPSPQRQKPKHKFILYLGRYHRNLTLATMQAAYLSIFLNWVNDQYQQRKLTYDEGKWESAAAGAIGRLFGKCTNSYMSASLPRQITLGNFIESINASRERHGFPAVFREQSLTGKNPASEPPP